MALLSHRYTCDRCGETFDADPGRGPQWAFEALPVRSKRRAVLTLLDQEELHACSKPCLDQLSGAFTREGIYEALQECASEFLANVQAQAATTQGEVQAAPIKTCGYVRFRAGAREECKLLEANCSGEHVYELPF